MRDFKNFQKFSEILQNCTETQYSHDLSTKFVRYSNGKIVTGLPNVWYSRHDPNTGLKVKSSDTFYHLNSRTLKIQFLDESALW